MSWNIKKVGQNPASLVAAVQADSACPQAVKDALCARISTPYNAPEAHQAILVESHGHMDIDQNGAAGFSSTDTIVLIVRIVDFVA